MSSGAPLVAVIIPTFNRAEKTARAISSVLRQTFKQCEIIVVDDGSTDKTGEYVGQFGPLLRFISHSGNLGVSAARNHGIAGSRAPFVAFLDSDDYWLPEKLAVQVRFFRENPMAVACQTEEIWIRRGRRVNPQKKHLKPSGEIFEPSLKLCLVSPSSVMLKRSLLDLVGLFDEDLPVCEDYDLWLRISCRYPIYLIRQHLVVKEGGEPDQLSSSFQGMDRFRIKALVKLLRSGQLRGHQYEPVLRELNRKCTIYGNGCLRRGRREEGAYYLRLVERLKKETSTA